MIIDTPTVVVPSIPPTRPLPSDRPGGGGTAVLTESERPLYDPEQGDAARRNDAQANTENRPGRNDAELVGRVRIELARERGDAVAEGGSGAAAVPGVPASSEPADPFLSSNEILQLRDRLESRLASEDGDPPRTLRSVDEVI